MKTRPTSSPRSQARPWVRLLAALGLGMAGLSAQAGPLRYQPVVGKPEPRTLDCDVAVYDGPVQMRNGDSNNAGSFSSDYIGGCHRWPDGTYEQGSFSKQTMTHRLPLICALLAAVGPLTAAPPNVVILFTDDQGTLDAGCYGSKDLITPNIVIFMSDNGHSEETTMRIKTDGHASGLPKGHFYAASGAGDTGKWIGHKGTFLEGGIRVPAILRFPGKSPAGEVRQIGSSELQPPPANR